MRNVKPMGAHGRMISETLMEIFSRAVPEWDTPDAHLKWADTLPKWTRRMMGLKILASQLPYYPHQAQPLPKYFAEWNRRYEAGEDMRVTYPETPLATAA